MVASNMCLRYLPFPIQVVGNCFKPVPVMIFSILLARKRYTLVKYLNVFLIVVGVVLFMYQDGTTINNADDDFTKGFLLLVCGLVAYGVFCGVQDMIRSGSKVSAFSMMYSINFYCTIILMVLAIASGQVVGFAEFAKRHIEIVSLVFGEAFCASIGQVFVFLIVAHFDSLTFTIISLARKFFTVLISVFVMGNDLILRQWIGMLIVFVILFADTIYDHIINVKKPDDKVDNEKRTDQLTATSPEIICVT